MIDLPEIGLGNSNLMKASLPEFVEIAARHGFRTITVRPYIFLEALRAGYTEAGLRRLLADAGVSVTVIDGLNNGLPGVPSPDRLPADVRPMMPPDVTRPADLATCLRSAEALHAPLLNVIAYRGEVVPVQRMAEAIADVARQSAAVGVRLSLEFLPDSGIPDLAHARSILRACARADCVLTLDSFHFDRSGGTADDIRNLPSGAIGSIQISDRADEADEGRPLSGRLMPGEGKLPLTEIVEAALANSPDATLDIEVLNGELAALSSDEAAHRLAVAASVWRRRVSPVLGNEELGTLPRTTQLD